MASAENVEPFLRQHRNLITLPIEEIRPGMRVIAENPELDEHRADTEIEEDQWRLVSMRREEELGSFEADRLVPLAWLKEKHIEVGSRIDLDVSEIDVHGQATVTAISDCPARFQEVPFSTSCC